VLQAPWYTEISLHTIAYLPISNLSMDCVAVALVYVCTLNIERVLRWLHLHLLLALDKIKLFIFILFLFLCMWSSVMRSHTASIRSSRNSLFMYTKGKESQLDVEKHFIVLVKCCLSMHFNNPYSK